MGVAAVAVDVVLDHVAVLIVEAARAALEREGQVLTFMTQTFLRLLLTVPFPHILFFDHIQIELRPRIFVDPYAAKLTQRPELRPF